MLSNPCASYIHAFYLILHPFASYFRADHLTFHPSIPLACDFCVVHSMGELFSCQPFNSPSFGDFFLCRPYNSPPVHRFEELFLCRPSIGRVIFVQTIQLSYPSIPLASYFLCRPSLAVSYFHADHLIPHPLASYFNVYHITLHKSIPLASYFCAIHPLGKLFSCQPLKSPVFGELFSCRPYNSPPIHPFGELFLCRPFNSPSFGKLFFVPII